jgi:dephospho-CoA kinase
MPLRLTVGLTGGIASGKTSAARRFAALGVPVIDADEAARSVVEPGSLGLAALVQRFGTGILGAEGALDRRALRRLAFADPEARRDLEAVLHPRIRAEMDRLASLATGPYLVMAIPLLVEGGDARRRVDRVLVIDVDERRQLERLMARDGGSEAEARAIVSAQATREQRLGQADDVIDNRGSLADLERAVDERHAVYLELAAGMQAHAAP